MAGRITAHRDWRTGRGVWYASRGTLLRWSIYIHMEGVWAVLGYIIILKGVGTSPSTFVKATGADMALR